MGNRLDVRTVAHGRWPGILLALGVDERTLSGRHGPCPMCGGKDRFRFDDREGRGTYYCSGCGAGDGVNLAMAYTGSTFREVADRIRAMVGDIQPGTRRPEQSDQDKRESLRRAWRDSRPIEDGDMVVRYLRGRGLALHDLPHSLRFHPSLPYVHNDCTAAFPAMLALVTGPDGTPRALHRTYLGQNGGKAPVAAPKKLMPGLGISGAAIRLTPVSACLGIAEGIETALAAFELFEVPVWSCISTSGIETFEPPPEVRELIVFADHDENFAGQAAAYRAAHRLSLRGYDVQVQIPPTPGDWLDDLARRSAKNDK